MHPAWFHVENEHEIPSPALLFYRERIDHNLKLMLKIAGGDAKRLRPHVKTHKTAQVIARQVELGITQFKCSTIAETEMCAANGATDVLLAMPCVGPNANRLAELAVKFPQVQFSSIADDVETLRLLASAAQQHGVILGVYLELDCGMGRTGIVPGDAAATLAHAMKDTPGVQFRGLHAYDGHIHDESIDLRRERCDAAFESVLRLRCRLQGEGVVVKELVAGGSPTFGIHAAHPDRTLSPGTTVLWDFGYGDKYPVDLPFQPAAVLLARVISKPGPNRITVDLGHKSVAPEQPQPRVRFEELPDATVIMQSEEHLVLETDRAHEFAIGQTLHGLPRHVCPSVSMHGEAYVIEIGKCTDRWAVTARNRRITV
ncbi:MAG TPA: D-TA family PLP-dependent enzyme [Prosthecobacter sp.]